MQNHREIGVFIYWLWLETLTKNHRKKAITTLENILSDMGLWGGDVHIVTNLKKSKNGKDVPIKPSIGGLKAKRFLLEHSFTHEVREENPGSVDSLAFGHWRARERVDGALKELFPIQFRATM